MTANIQLFDSQATFNLAGGQDFARAFSQINTELMRTTTNLISVGTATGGFDAVDAKMKRAASSAGGLGPSLGRGTAGFAVFEQAVGGALRGLTGLDTANRKVVVGLTQFSSMFIGGLGMGVIPGLAMAATAAISSLFANWVKDASEAKASVDRIAASMKDLGKLSQQSRGLGFTAAGEVSYSDRALALSRQATKRQEELDKVDETRRQLSRDVQAGVPGALEELAKVQKQAEDIRIGPRIEGQGLTFDKSKTIDTIESQAKAFAEAAIEKANEALKEAEAAASEAPEDELAEASREAAKAAKEFRDMLVALANDPLLEGVAAKIYGGLDQQLSGLASVEKFHARRADQLAKEQQNQKEMEKFERDRELIGKTPEEKKAIEEQRRTDDFVDLAKRLGATQGEIDALLADFAKEKEFDLAKEIAKTQPKGGGGFVGLQEAHRHMQAQVFKDDADRQTAKNTKDLVDIMKDIRDRKPPSSQPPVAVLG